MSLCFRFCFPVGKLSEPGPAPRPPIPPIPIPRRVNAYMAMLTELSVGPKTSTTMFVFGPGYQQNTLALAYTVDTREADCRLTLDLSRLEIKHLALVAFQLGIDLDGPDDAELGLVTVGTRVDGRESGGYLRPARKFGKRYAAYQHALQDPVDPQAWYVEWDAPLHDRQVNILTLMFVTSLR